MNYLSSFKMLKISMFFITVLFSASLKAQISIIPLNNQFQRTIEKYNLCNEKGLHTSFRQLLFADVVADSIMFYSQNKENFVDSRKAKWFWKRLLTDNFIDIKDTGYNLIINPLFNFQLLQVKGSDSLLSTNTRGFELKGNIGKKLIFYSAFYENQAFFPNYIDEYIDNQLVVPGQGASKEFNSGGHDFSTANGYLIYIPFNWLTFQFGNGKFFSGFGYRSLLLSDNSSNYPFLRAELKYKKWQYNVVWAEFQDFKNYYWTYHQRKYASFNYLSWKAVNNLELGVFQAIIWNRAENNGFLNAPIGFYNPFIFSNLFGVSLNSENNLLLGINAALHFYKSFQVYGQFALDDLKNSKKGFANRYSYQYGIKYFGSKNTNSVFYNLFSQVEYNFSEPYTYAHYNTQQSYSHYNQPLAHQLGGGFSEFVFITSYKLKSFIFEYSFSNAKNSIDTLHSNFGSNIFLSTESATFVDDNDFNIGQGIKNTIKNQRIQISWLINQRTNWQIFLGMYKREIENAEYNNTTNYIYFGTKTSLRNIYYDF